MIIYLDRMMKMLNYLGHYYYKFIDYPMIKLFINIYYYQLLQYNYLILINYLLYYNFNILKSNLFMLGSHSRNIMENHNFKINYTN